MTNPQGRVLQTVRCEIWQTEVAAGIAVDQMGRVRRAEQNATAIPDGYIPSTAVVEDAVKDFWVVREDMPDDVAMRVALSNALARIARDTLGWAAP